MHIHLLNCKNGSTHIYELVDDDLIHIDSPLTPDTDERLEEHYDECGQDPELVQVDEFEQI